jgi:hypothetical protein
MGLISRVMDKSWEQVQKKTFTNWINNNLKQVSANPIVNLATDLSSGENLIILLGMLSRVT